MREGGTTEVDDLARKTLLGFTQLIAALGVVLIAPAWTFNYWQAWVYSLVFAHVFRGTHSALWYASCAWIMVGAPDVHPDDVHDRVASLRRGAVSFPKSIRLPGVLSDRSISSGAVCLVTGGRRKAAGRRRQKGIQAPRDFRYLDCGDILPTPLTGDR
jgi:hypothetical protein